jgi:hypothetical protein
LFASELSARERKKSHTSLVGVEDLVDNVGMTDALLLTSLSVASAFLNLSCPLFCGCSCHPTCESALCKSAAPGVSHKTQLQHCLGKDGGMVLDLSLMRGKIM